MFILPPRFIPTTDRWGGNGNRYRSLKKKKKCIIIYQTVRFNTSLAMEPVNCSRVRWILKSSVRTLDCSYLLDSPPTSVGWQERNCDGSDCCKIRDFKRRVQDILCLHEIETKVIK